MNKITKKSFYSFLTLYLLSSFVFLSLASYWFYTAQVSMEMSSDYNKMNSITSKVNSDLKYAHMMNEEFVLKLFPNVSVALYDENKNLKYGSTLQKVDFSKRYYLDGETYTLISQKEIAHVGIKYIVIQNNKCTKNIAKLKNKILFVAIIVAFVIIIISVILSYMFLKPIKDKMLEIENFVKDTTHELNTPITALMMSTSRIKTKKEYDENIVKNISISTKQLYEIYSSLTFLSFDTSSEEAVYLDFNNIVHDSIEYFSELLERKNISLEFNEKKCVLHIAPTKAKMLVNNLLSNAIKYSPPNTKISIHSTQDFFSIKDEGIGIEKKKLNTIFKRFTRASKYAGGFGVGLNIVHNITKEYSYKIYIESKVNEGTEVTISFEQNI